MGELSKWEEQAYRELMAREAQYEKEIARALTDALNRMRGAMQGLYDKYATDGILTKAEMTRYARYAGMERQMLAILSPALRANLKTIKRLTPEQYEAAFFRYAWAVEMGAGAHLRWGLMNLDTVLEDLANKYDKLAAKRYTPEAKAQVRKALTNGLTQGKSYQQMARDLRRAVDITYNNALRTLRTEGQTAVCAGQSDAYVRAGVAGVNGSTVWDATLDGVTRPTHAAMDGKARGDDGWFGPGPGGNRCQYPTAADLPAKERINCRCRLRFQIDGFEPQLRRTREQGVIPFMSYNQWQAKGFGPKVKG